MMPQGVVSTEKITGADVLADVEEMKAALRVQTYPDIEDEIKEYKEEFMKNLRPCLPPGAPVSCCEVCGNIQVNSEGPFGRFWPALMLCFMCAFRAEGYYEGGLKRLRIGEEWEPIEFKGKYGIEEISTG